MSKAQHGHDFGRGGDIEAAGTVGAAAEIEFHLAQRAVVQVHDAAPGDRLRVDVERVFPVEVTVDNGGEQVVRRRDGVHVPIEMEVDIRLRHDPGPAAAGRAALHSETGAE